MPKYPFDGWTRVAVLPALNNPGFPTLDEIADGVDITCDLTADGLKLSREMSTATRTAWASDVDYEAPVRYGFSAELEGFRFQPPDDEVLWDAAAEFRAEAFLVVRRGVATAVAWAAGQAVETYRFRWGKRGVYDSQADALVTFTVPIHIIEDDDSAEVASS